MDESTVKAASFFETFFGTFEQRFFGTQTISAWFPFDITTSPSLKPLTPAPTDITSPTLQ